MAFDLKSIDFKKFDYKKIKYEVNIGTNDQRIRYGAGCVALLVSVFLGNVFLLIVGCALVASAHVRWCPAYSALEQNTLEAGKTTEGG